MKTAKIKNSDIEYPVGKIVCAGRNYIEHIKELDNEIPEFPLLFLKPSSSIIYSGGEIIRPNYSNVMHHEVELILLIGKTIKNAHEEDADHAIAGYGVGLDLTLRDKQNEARAKGHPWTIAKVFDSSAVISDFISTKNYRLSLSESISLIVNGEVKQQDKLNKMIFPPIQLVQYISTIMTLEQGDIIFTGTPAGVGILKKGDSIVAEISNVAKLTCTVS